MAKASEPAKSINRATAREGEDIIRADDATVPGASRAP